MPADPNLPSAESGNDDEPMTESQFQLALAHTSISARMAKAAHRVLVLGEMQKDVAEDEGMKPPQLSEAVTTLKRALDKQLDKHDIEVVVLAVPRKLKNEALAFEAYLLSPILHERQRRKRKRKQEDLPSTDD